MASTASTGIVFNARAINRTGRVFSQITRGAIGAAKSVAMIGAGALAGAATAIAMTAKSLGKLSDVAQAAGVSANEISKMSSAMEVLGIKSSTPEQLATAFQKMAKTTGETGVEGFEKVIGSISQMGTVEERAAAAMATFGKSGMDFLPLIEAAAQNGTAALHDVIAAMPGVSQSAADAGDKMADGMKIMGDGIKTLYQEGIAKVIQLIDSQFAGGIREAALKGAAYMEYFAKVAWRYVSTFYKSWSESSGGLMEGLATLVKNGLSIIGDVIWAAFQSIGAKIRGVTDKLVEMFSTAIIFVRDGKEAAIEFLREWEKNQQTAAEMAEQPWKDLAKKVKGYKWFPDGISVDTSDIFDKLQGDLEKAGKAAAAIGSAAVSISANAAATETAEQIETAAKTAAKAEFMTADTYRAATMSIRADYGKGESKTVKAIDRVKSINEKIQKACEDTASALTNIKEV